MIVEEGDIVDIGNRHFEVLHLPGHSPGSIGLWEASTGTLFSGDALYDGPLLDQLPTSGLFSRIDPPRQQVLLDGIGEVIDRAGGRFTMHWTTAAIAAHTLA